MLPFSSAIDAITRGLKVSREGWNGKGMHIELVKPILDEVSTEDYIVMHTAQGDVIPWLASQADLLANDWIIK